MIPGSANPLLLRSAAAGGYTIERSLRFNSADSAYLSRTPASAGNRKTWTWAGWMKRSTLASQGGFFSAGTGGTNDTSLIFGGDDIIDWFNRASGSINARLQTTAFFRDCSAWYHCVFVWNTTVATASERMQIWVNGSRINTFSSATYPSQNTDSAINNNVITYVGTQTLDTNFNGYLADIHFIDGQALDPTSFGEFSATTGVWVPKAFTGSYGTNGFRLPFSDNSAATATTLGKDAAGSNNWTPNNLSVTAGSGNDSLVDVPTNGAETDTGAGGEVRGNYCTLSAVDNNGGTLSNGNLQKTSTGATNVSGTIAMPSGKWYWEITVDRVGSGGVVGIGASSAMAGTALSNLSKIYGYAPDGNKYANTTASSYGASFTAGDIIGVKFDADTRQLEFLKNNSSQGVAFTVDSGFVYFPQLHLNNTDVTVNFGQRPFAYTAPSGFKALNTANLPAPTIVKGSTAMDVLLWSGNGSNPRTFTGLNFSPDFAWLKTRNSGAWSHCLFDQLRGNAVLHTNLTNAETATHPYGYVSAFTSDGFTVAAGSSGDEQVNDSALTYVGWAWDAGSSTVTNTDGSISSQVRANASAGFSVVTWTGDGAASRTVGHGLGIAPKLYLVKRRNGTSDFVAFTTNLIASQTPGFLNLNSTSAIGAASQPVPTSSVLNIESVFDNISTATYVAYCFAPVAGYSAFGSYTGNGNVNGPFVYLGFRPALVIVKMSSSTGNWTILDNKREGYNVDNDPLFPNLANAEGTTDLIDITSNGFKVRTTDATFNTNAGTYVYAAWAESPFQHSRAR
jgi:hypothetical protein